jgi:hypothetical protein
MKTRKAFVPAFDSGEKMKTNVAMKYPVPLTAEGAPAKRITAEQELRRLTAACLLWEDNFYESGKQIGDRIAKLVPQCRPEFVAACAYEARTKQKLRHLPLLVCVEMLKHPLHKSLVGALLTDVIQRADEITEFLAIYWKDGRRPIAAQAKKALAKAFLKFDEHQLAKYNRDGAVKLRDVLFMVHAKPDSADREALWKKLAANELAVPDTWEVALSGGADKKATFERLMAENNLGALAFLRNMRNMQEAGVSVDVVKAYAETARIDRVLPFRFIAAARVVPQWEPIIEPMMMRALAGKEKLAGNTCLLIDVSGSMDHSISAKSDLRRVDAACGLAILLRELCEQITVATFSKQLIGVAPRRGFALRDAIITSQPHSNTMLGAAIEGINRGVPHDRLIVITDEQSHDVVGNPLGKGYVINVASNRNGVGYGAWTHIDGWSEACIDYIQQFEAM